MCPNCKKIMVVKTVGDISSISVEATTEEKERRIVHILVEGVGYIKDLRAIPGFSKTFPKAAALMHDIEPFVKGGATWYRYGKEEFNGKYVSDIQYATEEEPVERDFSKTRPTGKIEKVSPKRLQSVWDSVVSLWQDLDERISELENVNTLETKSKVMEPAQPESLPVVDRKSQITTQPERIEELPILSGMYKHTAHKLIEDKLNELVAAINKLNGYDQ